MNTTLNDFLSTTDKNKLGLTNELLIAGNLAKCNYTVTVLNDYNENYDITFKKNESIKYLECKIDNKASSSKNFYFEWWNYTYKRYTGICNNNMNTYYSHTFKNGDSWYCLIGKRQQFYDTVIKLKGINKHYVAEYDKAYIIDNTLKGDSAYLVDKKQFIKYFTGKTIKLNACFTWHN